MKTGVLETLFHTPFVLTSHPEAAIPMIVPGVPPTSQP